MENSLQEETIQVDAHKSAVSSDTQPFWTVEEVAKYLRLEPETIRSMAREGKLPAIKVGRVWRFRRELVKEWIHGKSNQSEG